MGSFSLQEFCFLSSVMLLLSGMTMPVVHKPSRRGNTKRMQHVVWKQGRTFAGTAPSKLRQVGQAS